MRLQGDANNLHGFEVDSRVYLLMKKLAFWMQFFLDPRISLLNSLLLPTATVILNSKRRTFLFWNLDTQPSLRQANLKIDAFFSF